MSNEQGTNSHLVQGITLFMDTYLELGKCFYTKNLDKLPKFLLEGCWQRLGTQIYFWTLTREYDSTVSLSTSYVQSHHIREQNWVSASLHSRKSSDGREGQAGGPVASEASITLWCHLWQGTYRVQPQIALLALASRLLPLYPHRDRHLSEVCMCI